MVLRRCRQCGATAGARDGRGLQDERVHALLREADLGYDPAGRPVEPNPHHAGRLVPEDLLPGIDAGAEQDGQSAREIVRKALTANLAS